MVTTHVAPSQVTSRTIPRSTTEITGISGSGTCSSHSMICRVETGGCAVITMRLPDTFVAGAAFRPEYSPMLRYACPAHHHGARDAWPRSIQASSTWLRAILCRRDHATGQADWRMPEQYRVRPVQV